MDERPPAQVDIRTGTVGPGRRSYTDIEIHCSSGMGFTHWLKTFFHRNRTSDRLKTKVWFSPKEHIENQYHRLIKAEGVRFEAASYLETKIKKEMKEEDEILVKTEELVKVETEEEKDDQYTPNSQRYLNCTFVSGVELQQLCFFY